MLEGCVMVGFNVTFTNDMFPFKKFRQETYKDESLQRDFQWVGSYSPWTNDR